MNLQETYAEDRARLHAIAVRYRNGIMTGAGEVSYLAARAERHLEKMENDLEKGCIDDGGLSRGFGKSAEGSGQDASGERPEGREEAERSNRVE